MNKLISVIVPIYNVEQYLIRCVDSIINQTYKNLEIILVDDGSPDNCGKICDEYALKDSRIKVVHKKNGGLSDARNAGMKVATGEYISYIDSDDYVSLDFIETLFNTMVSENSDIVECSVVKFYENENIDEYSDDLSVNSFSTVEGLSGLISEKPFKQHVWNKLYKAELVLHAPFAVGKLNEDEFWTYQIFGNASKVTRINKTMYYYFQRSDSIMGNNYSVRRLDALEAKLNRQKYIESNFSQLASKAKIDLFASVMFAYQSVLKFMNGTDKRKAIRIIKKYHKKCKLSFDEINSINNGAKKWLFLAKLNFYLCCKFRAVFDIGF